MSVFIILSEITFEIILNFLRRNLHLYSVGYEKFNIMRDCNPEVTEISMNVFCNSYKHTRTQKNHHTSI